MNTEKDLVSLVVPCYNEQEVLPLFYQAICNLRQEWDDAEIEMIFVDDGSSDKTLDILRLLRRKDPTVRYISFSRNFGKEAAILAGLDAAKGTLVATIDADLQDPPSLLPEMVRLIREEGYDSVGTRRVTRKGEPPIRSFFARMFYKIINRMSKTEMVDGARDFRLMTRQVTDAVLSLREYNRYSKGLFGFVGFKTKWLEFENRQRAAGETKWSFWKLFLYAMDGIVAFSTAPLSIASWCGFLFVAIALIATAVIVIKTLVFGDPVGGWPSLACILFFIGGVQLFCLGIIGQYLSKTYLETKQRPIYIIKETEENSPRLRD